MTFKTVATVFAAVAVSMTLVFATYVIAEVIIDESPKIEFPMSDAPESAPNAPVERVQQTN